MELATQEQLTSVEIGRLMHRLSKPPFSLKEADATGVVSLVCEAPAAFINFLYSTEHYSKSALNYLEHVVKEFTGMDVGKGYSR